MLVKILAGDLLVGTAAIEHLDPPMGVAFGPFSPTEGYDSADHANLIEGEYVGDKGQTLVATGDQCGVLDAAIAISDWSSSKPGHELTLFFNNGLTFAALFSTHADYRTYYPASENG